MSVIKQDCYLLRCDECGGDFENDYVPHFKDELSAYEYVLDDDGSVITDGLHNKVFCGGCTTAERHEQSLDGADIRAVFAAPTQHNIERR